MPVFFFLSTTSKLWPKWVASQRKESVNVAYKLAMGCETDSQANKRLTQVAIKPFHWSLVFARTPVLRKPTLKLDLLQAALFFSETKEMWLQNACYARCMKVLVHNF